MADNESIEARPEAPKRTAERARALSYDEQILGRTESVFDAGVVFGAETRGEGEVPGRQARPNSGSESSDRRRRVKLQARRVRRIVRHIEPWSVLKLSVVFFACMWLILLIAGVLLWAVAEEYQVLQNTEDLAEDLFGLDDENEFWNGSLIFRSYSIATLLLCISGICVNVIMCVIYNLVADLIGGIRMTVIEEESARFRHPEPRVE